MLELNCNKGSILDRHQFWALVLISVLCLLVAPSIWYYTPDGGVYIGTAQSMLESGQYSFNGYPNLLYYPGFPSLLCAPISIFGVNFHILHLFCAGIAVASLWLMRTYFSFERYGIVGLFVPLLVACSWIFQEQVFYILSDGTFLAVSLAALLLWRAYAEESNRWALGGCLLLVAFSPMVRFHGLFLVLALPGALFLRSVSKKGVSVSGLITASAAGLAGIIPFALWTWRNVKQFTPDTFNMANSFFFGQEGLSLYAPDFMRVDWIDAEWQYGIFQSARLVRGLAVTFLGEDFVGLLPSALVVGVLILLIVIGSIRLLKLASNMERLYLFLSAAFFIYDSLNSHNLYIKPRHWLLLAPFVLVAIGFSLQWVYNLAANINYKVIVGTIIAFLVVLIFSYGVGVCLRYVHRSDYYRNANKVLKEVKVYVDENIPPETPLASTDWGVTPFVLERVCYKLPTGELFDLSLERMNKYQTEYLVIVDGLGNAAPYSHKMVEELPQFFSIRLNIKAKEESPGAWVYKVNLDQVEEYLSKRSES